MSRDASIPTLYGISNIIAELLDREDDAALTELGEQLPVLEAKVSNVVAWIEYTDDMAETLKHREDAIKAARIALEAKAERARKYLIENMLKAEVMKITDTRSGRTIGLAKNPSHVEIDDLGLIPNEYWRQPPLPDRVLDKGALAETLKDTPLPGAHMAAGWRLKVT